jgi:hypothetical protein
VKHEIGMRVGHRTAHLHEDAEALAEVEAVLGDVAVDGNPLDILERQKWLTVLGHPGVVEPRDIGMLQGGEDVAFPRHPLRQLRLGQPPVRKLERHSSLECLVDALGQPDRPHAAPTQLPLQPVGADDIPGRTGGSIDVSRQQCARGQLGECTEEVVRLERLRPRQEIRDQRAKLRIHPGQRLEPGAAFRGVQGESHIEQAVEVTQAFRGQLQGHAIRV